jgi:hypothetical protein
MSATRHLRATSSSAQRAILAIILASFIILGTTYALVTPAFEASDELWHYPMIRHLADGNPLPVQVYDPAEAGPWKQEASQPPLYYYLGAALTFWIDTSDMETVRWLNPHVDNGVITADGNTNLAIHDPPLIPGRGTLLAIRIVRLASVCSAPPLSTSPTASPGWSPLQQPGVYLGAAAVNAFMPMFLFISGAVNNDNLAIPLASLAVLLLIQTVVQRLASPRRWLLIGAVVGLAALTKEGTLGLLPLAWGTAVVAAGRQRPRREAGGSSAALAAPGNRRLRPASAARPAHRRLVVCAQPACTVTCLAGVPSSPCSASALSLQPCPALGRARRLSRLLLGPVRRRQHPHGRLDLHRPQHC